MTMVDHTDQVKLHFLIYFALWYLQNQLYSYAFHILK